MNWAEKLTLVTDRVIATFGAISTVTGIVPVQVVRSVGASLADFDFLAPVANHIYFIDKIMCVRTSAITGNPFLQAYDLAPAVSTLYDPSVVSQYASLSSFFVTRLSHLKNGASGGSYSIVFEGFDITYT